MNNQATGQVGLESQVSLEALEAEVKRRGSESLATLVWLAKLARACTEDRASVSDALLALPRSLGRFRLDSLLGAGGYGAVFSAFDQLLGRRVALKLAWPGVLVNPIVSKRFADEPRAMAAVKHPGIVEVYDAGEIDMVGFIAMELVEGPTLAAWGEGKQLPIATAVMIVRDVAQAIEFAHRRGVVHRDLKPTNLLLRPVSRSGGVPFDPVVTDFGLAHQVQVTSRSMLTATCAVVGTDHYMSPEQAAGRVREVGPQSDVFSLGVILYELLAGIRPFDGESSEEVRDHIRNSDPQPVVSLRRGLSRDLDTIVHKCLEKAPADRYATAQALADDLDRVLQNEPIQGRPATLRRRIARFVRRHPIIASTSAVCAVAAVVIAWLLGAMLWERRVAADLSEQRRQQQYASTIRRAAGALEQNQRHEALELLAETRSLADPQVGPGIEWRLLWAQAHPAERTIAAHRGGINAIRFLPGDRTLASGGDDGTVRVWDIATGEQLVRFDDELGKVTALEISADGRFLLAGGDNGRAVVRSLSDHTMVFDRVVCAGRVRCLAWLADDARFGVGSDSHLLTVCDIRSDDCDCIPISFRLADGTTGQAKSIASIAFLPDRNSLAVTTGTCGIVLLDPVTFEYQDTWCSDGVVTMVCRLGGEAERLGAYNYRRKLHIFPDSGVAPAQSSFTGLCVRYSTALQRFVVGGSNGAGEMVSISAQGEAVRKGHSVPCQDDPIRAIDVSASGAQIAVSGDEGKIVVFSGAGHVNRQDVTRSIMPCALQFSPCGRWLALLEGDSGDPGRLSVFDAVSREQMWQTNDRLGGQPIGTALTYLPHLRVAFSPDGDSLTYLDDDRRLCEFAARTGDLVKVFALPFGPPPDQLWYTPNGHLIASTQGRERGILLDRRLGRVITTREGYGARCIGAYKTIHGDVLVEPATSQNVVLRDPISGMVVRTLEGVSEHMAITAVSPDGSMLAASGYNHMIYLWNLKQNGPPSRLVGHSQPVYSMCFSSDSRSLLSLGSDERVRLWNVATAIEMQSLGSAQDRIQAFALHPTDSLLVLAVIDELGEYSLRFHDLSGDRELRRQDIRSSVVRNAASDVDP